LGHFSVLFGQAAQPAPEGSNPQDKLFVRQAVLGGQAEVELSKIAQKKSSNESVRAERSAEKIFDGDAARGDGSPRARQRELRDTHSGRRLAEVTAPGVGRAW
jgi:hypothetical protein